MAHDKIRMSITRAEAADRLEQIAAQLRSGSVSLGGPRLMSRTKLNSKAKQSQTNSSLK
jgi:hypothetical protein